MVIVSLTIATPAYAYDDYFGTDGSDPGARLYWTAHGGPVEACDREADAYVALLGGATSRPCRVSR
jgi:hypothetical protein